MHVVVLGYLRQQLFDEATHVTPMPQPLFMHVLRPVATIAPQPQPPRKNDQATRRRVRPSTDAQQPATESVQNELVEAAPDDKQVAQPEPQVLTDAAESVNAESPTSAEPLAPTPSRQDAWPVDTRLSYSVKGYYRGDFYGWGQVQWQHSDGRYQVQVDMRLALLFTGTLISQGGVTANGLQPSIYEERGMGRARRMLFDGTMVTFNDGSQTEQPHGVQDTASQFVELSHRFSSGRQALEVGGEVSVWLARPREMHLWTYDVIALDTLALPELGEVQAFHLKPRPVANPRGVINAELWFAPSLQYLPVRIRVNLGGDNYVEMTVKRIEQGATPVTAAP